MIGTDSRKRTRRRGGSRPLLAVAIAALIASAAASADAARLVEVRVGRHPEFVRVVFETDAPATFSIETGGAAGETLVLLDAELAARVAPRSAADAAGAEVVLEALPGGATLARIRAAVPVRVESQVLDEPPRVVLDLRPGATTAEPPRVAEEPERPLESVAASPAVSATEPPAMDPGGADEAADEGAEDPLATLLTEWPEPPAPSEAPAESPESSERLPPVAAPPPPVSAPPPAAIAARFDERSLVIGGVSGLVLGVALSLLGRNRRDEGARPDREPSPPGEAREREIAAGASREPPPEDVRAPVTSDRGAGVEEGGAAAGAGFMERAEALLGGPRIGRDSLAADLLQMIQRLDDRSARGDELLAGLQKRVEWLDSRTNAQAEELAAQRLALARLERAVGRPPVRLAAAAPGRGKPPASRRPHES